MNETTLLYKNLEILCNLTTTWKSENITYNGLDSFINNNLDKFFSFSSEFEKERKIEILLNFRDRIIQELKCCAGNILALAISGIAHEVFKEGNHSIDKPPEILDQMTYHILSQNLHNLQEIFLKDTQDILITAKFKENLDNATIKLLDEDKICLSDFGLENSDDAVDYIITHRHQISNANLNNYYSLNPLCLEKLSVDYPNLQKLNLSRCFYKYNIPSILRTLGQMTSLKYLNISQNNYDDYEMDVMFALKKLTSLKHLNMDNSRIIDAGENRIISLTNLSIAIEEMNDLECLVIPIYYYLQNKDEDKINKLVSVLEKLPSLKFIFTKDTTLLYKLSEKLKNVKVEKYSNKDSRFHTN